MKKKILALIGGIIFVVSLGACEKKETPKSVQQVQPGPIMQGPISKDTQKGVPHSVSPIKGGIQVIVPDSVKDKWSGVKIVIEDKIAKKTKEYTLNLNSDFKIPDSNLKVTIGEFLPDFKMDGDIISSASNKPNNPAVGIRVYEGEKRVFPALGRQWGWLWAQKVFQATHPFEHQRYSITLKEGVKKG
ncbi:MAG: hypothetical protein AABY78_09765 [Nitrospirota bacterium]